MKKILLLFTLLISSLGIAQTFDNIPTGEGYYINKIIASPPTVYDDGAGGQTLETTATVITKELTLEYYEFRGPAGEACPDNLYFVGVEGDGEAGKTDMGKVDEAISLAGYSFGSNGMIAIVSNYTDTGDSSVLMNPYTASIAAGTTIITIELEGADVTSTSSSGVTSKNPDIGYDGNIEDYSVTYMLITSGTVGSPVNPKGHDIDTDNDGVIDGLDGTDDEHVTDWVLYDSISYLDNDDQLDDNGGTDTGEYGYGQIIFARDLDDKPTSYKTTTSALVIDQGSSNLSFIARQGYKTGHTENDWMVGANTKGTNVPPAWKFTSSGSEKVHPDWTGSQAFVTDITYGAINPIQTNKWTGEITDDWGTPGNWDLGFVPTKGGDVEIQWTVENPITTYPTIGSTTAVNVYDLKISSAKLYVNSGGSLIVKGDISGSIYYNLTVPDTNWHLYSSPVSEQYNDTWVADNSIAHGIVNTNNRGIATYQNGTPDVDSGPWTYMQAGDPDDFFDRGVGYSFKRTTPGDITFRGTISENEFSIRPISKNDTSWNLLGNPYPSYMDVEEFINENTVDFPSEFQALYVFDGSTYSALTTGYLHPGQAFFVNSVAATGAVMFWKDNLENDYQAGTTLYKTSDEAITLTVSDRSNFKSTYINYLEGKTTGLDPRFDIGLFDGDASNLNIFTNLVSNDKGISFQTQTLPNSDLESMVIPVGIKAASGKEITFTADALNLPSGLKVFLEDKLTNTFTRLDEANANYKVTLTETLDGIGRFYLHTSSKSVLSLESSVALDNISIYKADASTLRIVGLQQGDANIKLYNVLGKQLLNSSFESNGVKEISLPRLATGVYIIQLETEAGSLNKKIILE